MHNIHCWQSSDLLHHNSNIIIWDAVVCYWSDPTTDEVWSPRPELLVISAHYTLCHKTNYTYAALSTI